LPFEPGGQILDPRRELGRADLADLVAEAALHLRLEPVPLIADPAELGPRDFEIGGQAGGADRGPGPLLTTENCPSSPRSQPGGAKPSCLGS
jgi:hypothetical protein